MHRRPRPRWALIPLVLIAVLVALAAGCGDDSEPSASAPATTAAAATDAFPVSATHALGTTVIPAEPKRVVALGITDPDIAVALGVTPVAIRKGNPDPIDPWLAEALGDVEPETIDVANGTPFEKIAQLRPDLILAGDLWTIDQDYARLSQIAPTIAHRGADPFTESWQQRALAVGEALGRTAEAQALVARVEAQIADAAEAHPERRGRTFSFSNYFEPGKMVTLQSGPVIDLFEQVGLKVAPGVLALPKEGAFGNASVSLERLDALRADVVMMLTQSPDLVGDLEGRPVVKRLMAAQGRGYVRVELELAVALRSPSALNIPWALEHLEPKLEAALG